jgi:hypothetical protein
MKAQFDVAEQQKKQMFDAVWDSYEGGSGGTSGGTKKSTPPQDTYSWPMA